jgi:[acyl-carrier-protein] S-malonyltransferase
MGKDIAEKHSEAMDLWKAAEKIIQAPLREIYWDGDDQTMAETRYQQPALVVVGLTIWDLVADKMSPRFLAGHSIGEYTALAAGNVLERKDILELVGLRARLMSEAGQEYPGKMAAVLRLDQKLVEDIVEQVKEQTGQVLCIANYNSPQQLVISGAAEAVDTACSLVAEQRGRSIILPVSGAFHSSLMQEAARELSQFMERFHWRDAAIPVYFNVTAAPEDKGEMICRIMQKQMISSVLWTQLIVSQWNAGVRNWYELGPKGVLSKLIKYILKGKDGQWNVNCLATFEQTSDFVASSSLA